MVDQSELAFRLLLQRLYQSSANEADNARSGEGSPTARAKGLLCYTPMLHSAMFVADHTYRSQRFASCLEEKANGGGLVAQFCGHNPATLLAAAKLVESKVDAVDLNLGKKPTVAFCIRYLDLDLIGVVDFLTLVCACFRLLSILVLAYFLYPPPKKNPLHSLTRLPSEHCTKGQLWVLPHAPRGPGGGDHPNLVDSAGRARDVQSQGVRHEIPDSRGARAAGHHQLLQALRSCGGSRAVRPREDEGPKRRQDRHR
jgi:hypothetical protein